MQKPTPNIKVIVTDDGSHSFHGAIQESNHVFIAAGLEHWLDTHGQKPIKILEVGFGTGLNALLTALAATDLKLSIRYTTLEPHPLPSEIVSGLNYGEQLSGATADSFFADIHDANWSVEVPISPHFTICKIKDTLQNASLPAGSFDLIYYDAFAPNKQPELWDIKVLEKTSILMNSHAVFVTYCAKGQLKRDLTSLGLQVETLSGPPGKKEMVRASVE